MGCSVQIRQLLQEYRSLAILSNSFNATYCRFIVPSLKFLFSLIAMMCALIAMRLNVDNSPGLALLVRGLFVSAAYFYAALLVVANVTSTLYERSTRLIWNFEHVPAATCNPKDYKHIRACARSMTPLRFAIGNFYYMEREAKLTLASFLLIGTGNLLIAFK